MPTLVRLNSCSGANKDIIIVAVFEREKLGLEILGFSNIVVPTWHSDRGIDVGVPKGNLLRKYGHSELLMTVIAP